MKKTLAIFICIVMTVTFFGCGAHNHNHGSTGDELHDHTHIEAQPTDGTGSVHEHDEDDYTVKDVSYKVEILNPNKPVYSDVCGSHVHDIGELGEVDIVGEVEVHGDKWGKLESGDGWIKLEAETLPETIFIFADGFDDWGTQLILSQNGAFSGEYWDGMPEAAGADFPLGTKYVAHFSGNLSDAKLKDEYTVSVKMTDLKYEGEIGSEEIVDGLKQIVAEPVGVDNNTEFLLYIPGTPKDKLPKDVLTWWSKRGAEMGDTLTQYCLYNTATGESFFGDVP